jgi:hypothetical protein
VSIKRDNARCPHLRRCVSDQQWHDRAVRYVYATPRVLHVLRRRNCARVVGSQSSWVQPIEGQYDDRNGVEARDLLPSQPARSSHLLEQLREFAGWDLADRPESADWRVLYQGATWVTLADDDPFAGIAPTWINGRCRDISKRTVEQVLAETFGYPLAVAP